MALLLFPLSLVYEIPAGVPLSRVKAVFFLSAIIEVVFCGGRDVGF
jgi:hypothetical protein